MRFSRQAFNRHLANIGQEVVWSKSYSCPCFSAHSGAADPKCPLCVGRGRIWDQGVPTVIGIASQKVQERWAKLGMYEVGDIVLSIPENSPMWDGGSQYDRVVAKNSLIGFSEVLIRGAPTERLRMKVNSVTRVFWRHPVTNMIVEGVIPEIDENGIPDWAENGPPPGTRYSITGDSFSEYFMVDGYPSNRNEHSGMRLPKNVVLRRWDLLGRAARTPAPTSS